MRKIGKRALCRIRRERAAARRAGWPWVLTLRDVQSIAEAVERVRKASELDVPRIKAGLEWIRRGFAEETLRMWEALHAAEAGLRIVVALRRLQAAQLADARGDREAAHVD